MKRRIFLPYVIIIINLLNIINVYSYVGSQQYCTTTGLSSFHSYNFDNPSLTPMDSNNILSLSVSPGLFNMEELQQNQILSNIMLIRNLNLSIEYIGINNNLFTDNTISSSISYVFNSIFQLGVSCNYNMYVVPNYSNTTSMILNIGGRVKLDKSLYAGFIIKNINRAIIAKDRNPEQIAKMGLAYKINENFVIESEASINIAKSSAISLATRYDIDNYIALRLAYISNPQIVSFGTNIRIFDLYYINYNINYNNILGYTHSFGLSLLW